MNVNELKRYVTSLTCLLVASGVAFSMSPCLRVTDINDNVSHFIVSENLRMDMIGEGVVIGADTYDMEIKLENLKSFGYELCTISEITEVSEEVPVINIGMDGIEISTLGEKPYSTKIYDLSGVVVSDFISSGNTRINLGTFSKGSYIIKVENFPSVKFIVK